MTAIGARMIGMGDERGWLHIYDENLLRRFEDATQQAADFCQRRRVLKLAGNHGPNPPWQVKAIVPGFFPTLGKQQMQEFQG